MVDGDAETRPPMSARANAGIRVCSGVRAKAPTRDHTRADEEAFCRGLHDFARRHGQRVAPATKPQITHAKPQMRQRNSPRSWHGALVSALARTGEIKSAARLAKVSPAVARNGISRDISLRARADIAISEHLRRQLAQVAKGQIKRLAIWPKKARALLAMLAPVTSTNPAMP